MNKLIKEFPRALFISIMIFFVLTIIPVLNGGNVSFDNHLKINFLYTMLYGIFLYYANAVLFMFLDSIYKNNRYAVKRLIIGFLSSFILSLFVIFLLRIFEDVIIEKHPLREFLEYEKPANYIVPSIVSFVVLLGIHALYFYKSLQENRVKEQKIIAGTASAKFESLKNQIDPHFLFNSLNVLSSLIEENPKNAQHFTTSLSKVYRYVLEQKDKDLVPIEEELAFAKTYINLLQMRFENSLTYEVLIENVNPEAKVVPLSLQLLLENAVKHNIISEQKPLQIKIFIENNDLIIQNNFQKKAVLQDGQGVGIQNIISRYHIITDRKVTIEQNEHTFTVKLPILTKQITIMENSNYDAENAYYKAKRQVDELRKFYTSLVSYCVVIPFLIFTNLKFSSQFQWFWFPMFGWGFGLIMKGLRVYGYSSNWEERKIQQFLNKEENNQNWK